MESKRVHHAIAIAALVAICLGIGRRSADAAEAAQGTFDNTLDDAFVCANGGGDFVAHLNFDDRTFNVPVPPGNNMLSIDFAALGPMTMTGSIHCVFDQGGTFVATGVNDTGDFTFTEMTGDYIDRVPGISTGDPFPFVGSAKCTTTRTDDFKTLCDNFAFSFNGLGRALPPNPWYKYYAGDFTFRTAEQTPVDPGPKVDVNTPVDGPGGAVPGVQVHFQNGVMAPGRLLVATLADAHGTIPPGLDLPVSGTTEIDHGSGPVPFFAGGDERFIEVSTDAALPSAPAIEVCLPLPAAGAPAEVRPVRVLHGEGSGPADRQFLDRTSRVDPTSGQACARVASFSRFAVVTGDACGGGQAQLDGLVTVAGGVRGKKTVVVDGLTDCTQYPANLPRGLAQYCVADADPAVGQCGLALTLGINRAGCNRSGQNSSFVDVASYGGSMTHGSSVHYLTPTFGPLIAALSSPVEAMVGPVLVSVPVGRRITTYTLRQHLTGWRPDVPQLEIDRDVLKLKCIDPAQF